MIVKSRRPSLIHLMGIVALLALVLAMIKVAAGWLASFVVLASIFVLLVATLGAIIDRRRRPSWTGFALFGWGYILIAAGGPFLTDQYSNEAQCDLWQVDGAIRFLVAQFHPAQSEPKDPFPENRIDIDEITGIRTKLVNAIKIRMTPDEVKLQLDYENRTAIYEAKTRAGRYSRAIGLAFQGLAFALIGGIVGKFLSNRSKITFAKTGIEMPTVGSGSG